MIWRKKNPKYLSVRAKGQKNYFYLNKGRRSITIVEDIVSAIKVGRYTDSIAVLGSYVSDNILDILRTVTVANGEITRTNHYDRVNIWLDDDKYFEGLKFAQRLRTFGLNVVTIKTKLDPKEQSDDTIKDLTDVK